jgi:hypothetical protein
MAFAVFQQVDNNIDNNNMVRMRISLLLDGQKALSNAHTCNGTRTLWVWMHSCDSSAYSAPTQRLDSPAKMENGVPGGEAS